MTNLAEDPRDAFFTVTDVKTQLGAKTGRSAVTVLISAGLKIFVALGAMAILARLVPPAEQGIIAMALPAMVIAAGLSEFGLAQAIVQREHVTHALVSTLFWTSVGLGLVLATAVALLGFPAAVFYGEPKVTNVFIAMAPYVLLSALSAQYVALLRRQMQIRRIETGMVGSALIGALLAIGAAYLGAGYWALAIQVMAAEAAGVVYLLWATRWIPSGPHRADFRAARAALSFGAFLAADRLLTEITNSLQVVVIGRVFSAVEAGLFFRAQTIAQMPRRRISSPLSGAFVPALSRLQDDPDAFRAMFARQITRANLIMVPIGLVFITCADLLVAVMLGPDWSAAVPLLAWMGLMPITGLTANSLTWAMVACGQGRDLFYFRLLSSVLVLGALIIGARFGLVGLVAIYLLNHALILTPLQAALAVWRTPISWEGLGRALIPDAALAGATAAAILWLRATFDLSLFWLEGCLAMAIIGLVYVLRIVLSPDLRADVLKVVGRRRG